MCVFRISVEIVNMWMSEMQICCYSKCGIILEEFNPHLPTLTLVLTISLILPLIMGFNYNEANVIMNWSGSQGVVERFLPILV
jgi:hypothetical protein